jgi:NADH:ubiquinone oxidoreductase subunit 2 (subunit N)
MEDIKLLRAIIGLLSLQFALGILANLYQEVPKHGPAKVFNQFGYIAFHALNGFLLLALAILYLVRMIRRGRPAKEAYNGLGSIVTAIVFGELFVFTQNDIFSFFMAMSFLSAPGRPE